MIPKHTETIACPACGFVITSEMWYDQNMERETIVVGKFKCSNCDAHGFISFAQGHKA